MAEMVNFMLRMLYFIAILKKGITGIGEENGRGGNIQAKN